MLFRSEHTGLFRGRPPWCSPWGLNWSLSRGLRTQESSGEEVAVKEEGLSHNTVRPPGAVKGLRWTSECFQRLRELICWLTQRFVCAFRPHSVVGTAFGSREGDAGEHCQHTRRAGAASREGSMKIRFHGLRLSEAPCTPAMCQSVGE